MRKSGLSSFLYLQADNSPIFSTFYDFTLGPKTSSAKTSLIYKNHLYTVGRLNDRPILWISKTDGSKKQTINLPISLENGSGEEIQVLNDHIYVLGLDYNPSISRLTLWITDSSGKLLKTTTLSDSGISPSPYDLLIHNSKIYVISRLNTYATLSILSSEGSIISQTTLKYTGVEASYPGELFITEDVVYIAGTSDNNQNETATVWMTDLNGNLTKVLAITGGGINSRALTLFVDKESMYIGGSQIVSGKYIPFCWIQNLKDSTLTPIQLTNSDFSGVTNKVQVNDGKIYLLGNLFTSIIPIVNKPFLWVLNLNGTIAQTIQIGAEGQARDFVIYDQNIYVIRSRNPDFRIF